LRFAFIPDRLCLGYSQIFVSQHHDFGFSVEVGDEIQADRYATLLLYLNKPEEGGETSFPRWQNAEVRLNQSVRHL
jgi:hypothetical protein